MPCKNIVFNKDVIKVLKDIPDNSLDMVYGDPDYNVGIKYAKGERYTQEWNKYVQWYCELAKESMRVLKPTGNLFFINYPKQNAYMRVKYLDEASHRIDDYVWVYNTNVGHSKKHFTVAHRSIIHATKTKNNNFYKDQVVMPYKNLNEKKIQERVKQGHKGRMPYSWFYFNLVKNTAKDKTFHSCQIPIPLFDMLLKSCTVENDNVFILFGGSGNEIIHTKNLKRNYISCEINRDYYNMIIDRLNKDGNIDTHHKMDFVKNRELNKKTS